MKTVQSSNHLWEIANPFDMLSNGTWVKVLANIKDTRTGEIRLHDTELCLRPREEWTPSSEGLPNYFTWEDGNNSCDCCRHDYFYKDGVQTPCGDGMFLVELSNPLDGKVFYTEFT